ncbi:hypothetical protein [Ralstonia soli]|uniref:Uncharacterized protein n=1 Tax=Ralstonia soli TaxID=2953896 RepID=A0ABT1AUA0_9RALS|nr:hypothetical protein [Ralstonia soli]MCO5401592.1 hypothetical protein [Ralstonia soli]
MDQLHAFLVTLACEVPLMLWLARRLPAPRVLLAALSANCLSHPVAWRVASLFPPDNYWSGVWLIEGSVIAFEAGWYWLWLRTGFPKTLAWSFLANAGSLSLGWLLWLV